MMVTKVNLYGATSLCSPASAGRAFVASDRDARSRPGGLQSLLPPRLWRCALRLPRPTPGARVGLKSSQRRHGYAVASEWRWPASGRAVVLEAVFLAVPLSLIALRTASIRRVGLAAANDKGASPASRAPANGLLRSCVLGCALVIHCRQSKAHVEAAPQGRTSRKGEQPWQ